MVREDPLWQDGNDYPARLDRQFIEDVFDTEGVIKTTNAGALLVGPRAAGANMSVDVAAGRAVIKGDDEANQGSYRIISTAVENLPIGAAPGSNSRIDLIVARVRDAAVTGGTASDWILEVIPGAVAASPVAPAVPVSAIPLAEVLVTSTTTSISGGITDRRPTAGSGAYLAKANNLSDLPDKAAARTNLGVVAAAGQKIWLSAPELAATFGAPSLAGVGASGDKAAIAWLFDAASSENISGQVYIPQGWGSVDLALAWTNAGTGTGDVRWHLFYEPSIGSTSTLGSALVGVANTSAAPAQNVMKFDLMASAVSVTELRIIGFRLQRDAPNAADTLGNDAAVLGLEVRRAS